MSLEQAAAFGEASATHSSRGEIFPAIEALDRGIAILEKHLHAATSSRASDVEKSDLRARLFDFLNRKCELLLQSGGTSAALNTALFMCSTDPRNAAGFFLAGQALRKLQRFEQAVDYLTTASKLDAASGQIQQCLELAMTELRMPSTVQLSANGVVTSGSSLSPARAGGAGGGDDNGSETITIGGVQVPLDVEGMVRLAKSYVPSANSLMKRAKQKPLHALGIAGAVLVVLIILVTWELVLFLGCATLVVAVHRWERKKMLVPGSGIGSAGFRIPVLEIPLCVLTSSFLSISFCYLLLM